MENIDSSVGVEQQEPSTALRIGRLVSGVAFGMAGFVETIDGLAELDPVRAIAGFGSVMVSQKIFGIIDSSRSRGVES